MFAAVETRAGVPSLDLRLRRKRSTKNTVAALTTSVAGPVDGFTPPTGDCGTGAVTFNVEPSDAAPADSPGVVGVRGVLDFDVHASVNPNSTVTPVTATEFRDIKSSKKR